jgi:anti-sigma factor RsiW
MNCRYVQSRLSAYLDFELSGDEQQLIRSHLEACIECSCEYESLRRTKQLLRQIPTVKPRIRVLSRCCCACVRRRLWRRALRGAFGGIRRACGSMPLGFALAAAILFWGRAADTETSPITTASPTPSYFTPSNPLSQLLLPNSPPCTDPTLPTCLDALPTL